MDGMAVAHSTNLRILLVRLFANFSVSCLRFFPLLIEPFDAGHVGLVLRTIRKTRPTAQSMTEFTGKSPR